jgi:hypothetical protein
MPSIRNMARSSGLNAEPAERQPQQASLRDGQSVGDDRVDSLVGLVGALTVFTAYFLNYAQTPLDLPSAPPATASGTGAPVSGGRE